MVRKSSLQEIATLVIIREISDSNLETERYSPKCGVSDNPGELTALDRDTFSGFRNLREKIWHASLFSQLFLL